MRRQNINSNYTSLLDGCVRLEELDIEVDVTELEREPLGDPNHKTVRYISNIYKLT